MTSPTSPTDPTKRTQPIEGEPEAKTPPRKKARRQQFGSSGSSSSSRSPDPSHLRVTQDRVQRLEALFVELEGAEDLKEACAKLPLLSAKIGALGPAASEAIGERFKDLAGHLMTKTIDQEQKVEPPATATQFMAFLPASEWTVVALSGMVRVALSEEYSRVAMAKVAECLNLQSDDYLADLRRLPPELRTEFLYGCASVDFLCRLTTRVFPNREDRLGKQAHISALYALIRVAEEQQNRENDRRVLEIWSNATEQQREAVRKVTQELGDAEVINQDVVAEQDRAKTVIDQLRLGEEQEIPALRFILSVIQNPQELRGMFSLYRKNVVDPYLAIERANPELERSLSDFREFAAALLDVWPDVNLSNIDLLLDRFRNENDPHYSDVAIAEQELLLREWSQTSDPEWKARLEEMIGYWKEDDPTLVLNRLHRELQQTTEQLKLHGYFLILNQFKQQREAGAVVLMSEIPVGSYLALIRAGDPRAGGFDDSMKGSVSDCAESAGRLVEKRDELFNRFKAWLEEMDPEAGTRLAEETSEFLRSMHAHWPPNNGSYERVLSLMAEAWRERGEGESAAKLGQIHRHLDELQLDRGPWLDAASELRNDLEDLEDSQVRRQAVSDFVVRSPPLFIELFAKSITSETGTNPLVDLIVATAQLPDSQEDKIQQVFKALVGQFWANDLTNHDRRDILNDLATWIPPALEEKGVLSKGFQEVFAEFRKLLFKLALTWGQETEGMELQGELNRVVTLLNAIPAVEWLRDHSDTLHPWELRNLVHYLLQVSDDEKKALLGLPLQQKARLFESISQTAQGIALLKQIRALATTTEDQSLMLRIFILSKDVSEDYVQQYQESSQIIKDGCWVLTEEEQERYRQLCRDNVDRLLSRISVEERAVVVWMRPEQVRQRFDSHLGNLNAMRAEYQFFSAWNQMWIYQSQAAENYTRFQYALTVRAVDQERELPWINDEVTEWVRLARYIDRAIDEQTEKDNARDRVVLAGYAKGPTLTTDEERQKARQDALIQRGMAEEDVAKSTVDEWMTWLANARVNREALLSMGLKEDFSDLEHFGLCEDADFKALGLGKGSDQDRETLEAFFKQMGGADRLRAWLATEGVTSLASYAEQKKLEPADLLKLGVQPEGGMS